MKRGQAAVEFLMNYGWVLLVVLAAVAALAYFGILTPGERLPETCIFFPGLSCDSFKVNESGISFMLTNGGGKKLENVTITVLGEGPCEGESSNSENLANGQQKEFIINCANSPIKGSAFRRELQVNYKEFNGLDHSKTGSIDTKVE